MNALNVSEYLMLKCSILLLICLCFLSCFVLIPLTIHILFLSLLILYIGSSFSLRLLNRNDPSSSSSSLQEQIITENDAYKIPFIASIALFLLYLIFYYFNKEIINFILLFYFCFLGLISLFLTLQSFFRVIDISNFNTLIFHYPSSSNSSSTSTSSFSFSSLNLSVTISDLLSAIISILIVYFYYKTKYFLLNNLLGISFIIQTLQQISIGSYRIGCIILIGLFFYDIFWVFGTDVMISVAKSFDAPIKLLFPKV